MPSFIANPRTWTSRRWFFWLHLYSGVIVGALTLVIGLSGAALVYSPELEVGPRWASGRVGRPLPLDELARRTAARHPRHRIEDIRFNAAGDATQLHLKMTDEGPGDGGSQKAKQTRKPGADLHVAVDPETGAVLKVADRQAGVWSFLRDLHHDLLAAKAGRVVNGIGAMALLFLCATGLVIWWPGPKQWKQRVTITPGTNWKRMNWDLHNAVGFWLAAGLAFFSLTGILYAFPDVTKKALRHLTGASPRPKRPKLAPVEGKGLSLAAVVARAQTAIPDGRVAQVKIPRKPDEPFEVRVKTTMDGHHEGNNKVFLHPVTGDVILVDRFDRLSPASRAIELLEPLHNARFMTLNRMSVLARLPWIAIGLAPGFLFITGFLMWWNRVLSKRWADGRFRGATPVRRAAGAVAVLQLLLLISGRVCAQEPSLAGRVVDPSGAPIMGAKIVLRVSPERSARTGPEGRFEFSNTAPGSYPASIDAPGFAVWNGTLRPGACQDVGLELAGAVEAITVNAGTLEQERLEDPLVSTGIGRKDIASRNNRRLSDVVSRLPGVFLTGPPGGEKDIRVRGLDKEYSRTQVDGVVIPDGGEKRELQLNRIPSSVVESVRLIRNPTAEYESDGLAGRVDVQTRPVPEGFHLDGRAGYGARGVAGNPLAQGQISVGARINRRFGFTAGYNLLNDNLPIDRVKGLANRNTESEREFQHQRSSNFFGDLGVYTQSLGDFHFKPVVLGFSTSMDKLKTSVNPAETLLSRSTETEEKSQQTRGLTLGHQFARAWGLVVDSQAGIYRSTEDKDKVAQSFKVTAGNFTPDKQTPEIESKADRTWNFSTAASMPLHLGVWNDLKFGTAIRFRDRYRDKSKFEVDLLGNRKDVSTPKDRYTIAEDYQAYFVQDRLRFSEKFSFMPGVRLERVVLNSRTPVSAAAPRVFLDVNPSAHLLYRVRRDLSVHAAVSRGLARPKFDELSPFETVSSTKITIGNPDLEPTRAWSYDAGIDYAVSRFSVSANAFRKTIRGVIEEVDTLANRGTLDIYQVQNVGNGWLAGIELEQRLRMPAQVPGWAKAFSIWSNQTMLRSRLLANNGFYRPFKEQPAWIANVGLDFNNDERSGTSVSVISNFTARRFDYKTNGDTTGKSGSTNFDMAVYQRIRGNWRLFAELNNVTNRDRTEDEMFVNGTVNRRAERYGRTILVGIAFGF